MNDISNLIIKTSNPVEVLDAYQAMHQNLLNYEYKNAPHFRRMSVKTIESHAVYYAKQKTIYKNEVNK